MLERVKDLNWPANLFSSPYLNVAPASSTAPLLAGAAKSLPAIIFVPVIVNSLTGRL
jgi:hypothetical protein